jgi:hypothetical protein
LRNQIQNILLPEPVLNTTSFEQFSFFGFRTEFHPLPPAPAALQPVDSLTCTNETMRKCRGDASIENQFKIDSLDQNRCAKYFGFDCSQGKTVQG